MAIEAGARIIGENRVQEAKQKFADLSENQLFQNVEKHLIGHLQKNKVKDAVRLFDMIQSVDSLDLAMAINRESAKLAKVMPVLLQVNISNDEGKSGFRPVELQAIFEALKDLKHIDVLGLMTITRHYDNLEDTRKDFLAMKKLFEEFNRYALIENPILSMGMSEDFELAVECGATMVRVGSKIFQQ